MEVTDEMVNRFLNWPVPTSVCSDLCVTRQGATDRMGTNLLNVFEARQMLEHVLAEAAESQLAEMRREPTDDEVMGYVINECDALDITRAHERRNGKWHTTTIFDGDEALLRVGRAVINATRATGGPVSDAERLHPINAGEQTPCGPLRSSPGLGESPDSTNGISHPLGAAILDETDSAIKSASPAPASPSEAGVKKPRLFYWEEAEDCWCPADGLSVENIIGVDDIPDDGGSHTIEFKRMDMTDEELDALPEG